MNLYLIKQTVNHAYDTFDSAVVAAKDVESARHIYPDAYSGSDKEKEYLTWAEPKDVSVTYVGKATKGIKAGEVICASFNAG